ncbi:acyltransferase family protein [Bacteroidota bacterium]
MKSERLASVDFFRGITMFLLIGEFTHIFTYMTSPLFEGGVLDWIGTQFHHHPWSGMRFWDLVQPFFMFIVGVAIPLSARKRTERGDSKPKLLKHAFGRAGLLLFFGWALYCIDPGKITFNFQNVLAQLSLTYLVAFLLRDTKNWIQIGVSVGVLILTEVLYRTFSVPGYDQPFTPDQNFGAWFDMLISGQLSGGHWVSFNAIPTTAHTIWGVLIGKLIIGSKTQRQKTVIMLLVGIGLIAAGMLYDLATPVIKRISTASFVVLSGGWSIIAMAVSYWIIDVKGYKNWSTMFAIVGMNPLFIYLFAHVGGADLVYNVFKPFTYFLMSWTDEIYGKLFTSLITWTFLWYLCYWLYKRRIFIKI